MGINIKEQQLIRKPVNFSEQDRTSPADLGTTSPGTQEVTLLARQIKQLKQIRAARQKRRIARRVARQTRGSKDGSLARTLVLVAIALTGLGGLAFIRDPRVSPREGETNVHAGIDIAVSQEMLPATPISQIDLEFIKRLEGFHSTPYFDGTQQSWGYGTMAGRGSITRGRAEQEMKAYLQKHCLPILPKELSAHEATALASFCYNLGPNQAQETNLWEAAHRGGDVNFLGYTRSARGVSLLSRRRKEQAMWEGRQR